MNHIEQCNCEQSLDLKAQIIKLVDTLKFTRKRLKRKGMYTSEIDNLLKKIK